MRVIVGFLNSVFEFFSPFFYVAPC